MITGANERETPSALEALRKARARVRYISLWMVLAALGIDLLLAPYTAVPIDTSVWLQATSSGYLGLRLYDRPGFAYPPVAGNLLVVLGRVIQLTGLRLSALYTTNLRLRPLVGAAPSDFTSTVTSPAFNIMSKALAAIPQVLIATLIVYAVRRCGGTDRRARLAGAAWLFNPLVLNEVGVHAATTDLFVALFSLLAVLLVIDDKPGWAGASLAAAVLTKITPLFLGPALLAAVVRREKSDHGGLDLAGGTRFLLGIGAALVALLAPEALAGSLGAMSRSAFSSRTTQLPGVGGLTLYGVRNLRLFSGLTAFVFAHSSIVISLTSILDVLIAFGVGLWVFRVAASRRTYATVAGAGIAFLAILITSPDTTPQYLLWCLPFIIVVAGAWYRSFTWPTMLGIAGWLFLLFLDGPLVLALPLATYSSALSVGTVEKSTLHWISSPARLWGENYAGDYLAVCVLVALVVMSVLLWQLWNVPRESPRLDVFEPVAASPNILRCAVVLLVTLSLIGAIAEAPSPGKRGNATLTSLTKSNVQIRVRMDVTNATTANALNLVAVPLVEPPHDRSISVFTDVAYPIVGATSDTILNFPVHLRSQARLARYNARIESVDASQMRAELLDTSTASQRVIVDLTGTLPRSIWARGTDLLSPWVRAGGVFVWGGDVLGYYSTLPHEKLNFEDPANPRDRGPTKLLGPNAVRLTTDLNSLGTVPTLGAQALGLLFDGSGSAVSEDFADAHGGSALGWDDRGYNSVVALPNGSGHYLIFGGPIYKEAEVAQDLMRILTSEMLFASAPISYEHVEVAHRSGRAYVQGTLAVPASTQFVAVTLLDPSPLGVDAWHWAASTTGQKSDWCAIAQSPPQIDCP